MEISIYQVSAYQTNCYLLCDEAEKVCALIDPGDSGAQLAKVVADTGFEFKAIYLTHGHSDHTGGVEALCQAYPQVPVYIHPKDGRDALPAMRSDSPALSVDAIDYGEGDVLTLGSLTLQVMETPGHTPGSVVLQCGDVLFTGDTLFAGSCGRTDFVGGDMGQMMASLKKLSTLEGQVLPGHMGGSTMERERQSNPYIRKAMR